MPLLPRQQGFERRPEIDAADLREACQALEVRAQPAGEIFLERLVRKIRPGGIDMVEERDPSPPLLQILRPGQTGQSCLLDAQKKRPQDCLMIGVVELTIVEDELPQPLLSSRQNAL